MKLFKIPSLILKQLYTFGSLENTDQGVRFGLKNRLSDATLTGLRALRLDGRDIALSQVVLELGAGVSVRAVDLTAESAVPFPLKRAVFIQILDHPPLAKGDHLNPAPVRVVTANRLGQFAAAGLVAGAWRVAARSMSYGLATATFDSKTPGPLLLTLPAGAQISGRVLDPDGQPAPRALLQAWAGRAEDEGLAARFGVRTFFAETDAQGRFTLRGLPETHALQLHAQLLGGKVSASGELRNVGTGSTDLEIVLKRQAP